MRIKKLLILLFGSIMPLLLSAQLTVTATIDKNMVRISGAIEKGWRLYNIKDTANGLMPLQIRFDNPSVHSEPYEIKAEVVDFSDPLFDNKKLAIIRDSFQLVQQISFQGVVPAALQLTVTGFISNGEEFLPVEKQMEIPVPGGVKNNELKIAAVDLNNPINNCGDRGNKSKGLLAIFLLGFGGGLIALLTPCIFPMIPVTVSFFTSKAATKQQGVRNAILYGSFIALIYILASAPFHVIGKINPQVFNVIATNAWVNIFFFVIFILFALSFFGLFDIQLPSSFSNKTANRGGIFFMALTLVIVSFSCTGIILGSLLVNALSADGNAWQLTTGMGGFGIALALPFALFALFPQWLNKLPRSGGWFTIVKRTLAFVELALALKFLSNADLVEHWGLLKREVFIGIWALIAFGLGIYLGSVRKLVAAFAVLFFAIFLLQGIRPGKNERLNFLSGFPPPLSYSIYKNNAHGLVADVINDYDKALLLSKQTGKPLLIDFTGWACVNCRKMEEQVWTDAGIQQLIKDKFILVSLYVDDRKKMSDGNTIGSKWAKFQETNFQQVTQPLYVVLSPQETLLNNPVGYTPKKTAFKDWLQCALQ